MHAKERLGSPRVRLFIALELPAELRTAVSEWQRSLVEAGDGELRAAGPQTLHVTLAFIGHRPEKDVPGIARIVEELRPRAVKFSIDPVPMPTPARRPRLYAAGLRSADDVVGMRIELVGELAAVAGFADEKRAFWPHLTLCRVKSRVRRHLPLVDPPELGDAAERSWSASAIKLFRSELDPAGAVHTPLASLALPAE